MMLGLDFDFLTRTSGEAMLHGMLVSLQVAGTALAVGLVWGTLLAIARLSPIKVLSWTSALYVNFFRSIPLAMVLLGFYLVVPQILKDLLPKGTQLDTRLMSALVGFSLFESAYYAEIMRAGIQSPGCCCESAGTQTVSSYAIGYLATSSSQHAAVVADSTHRSVSRYVTGLCDSPSGFFYQRRGYW